MVELLLFCAADCFSAPSFSQLGLAPVWAVDVKDSSVVMNAVAAIASDTFLKVDRGLFDMISLLHL